MRALTTLAQHCEKHALPYFETARAVSPRPLVVHLDGEHLPFQLGSPQVYCGNVRDAQFAGHSYIRVGGDFIVDGQSFAMDPTRNGFHFYAAQTDKTPAYTFPGEHIFIGGAWHDPDPTHGVPNFGHFLFEFASRLAIFDRYGLLDRPAFVYQSIPDRWLDFLMLAGVGRFTHIDPAAPPRYENAWTTSCPFQRGAGGEFSIWAPAVHWLRNRLVRNADTRKRRRVYINRGNAKWRFVVNEPDVVEVLRRKGFDIMDPTQLSAAEQVQWMAEADVVVAAAGAGTVITQFCPEHCRIMILNPMNSRGLWGGLGHAIILRQSYDRLECGNLHAGDVARKNMDGENELANYVVDLDALERVLSIIL